MGVWIEIQPRIWDKHPSFVTPFMGVWIEILHSETRPSISLVTPFMGVWIEMIVPVEGPAAPYRHTLYGCVD